MTGSNPNQSAAERSRRLWLAGAAGIAFVLVAAASACGSRATRLPAGSATPSPAAASHSQSSQGAPTTTAQPTGWIPPGPQLPPNAVPTQAPNIIWLDTLNSWGPLVVDRVTSLSTPARRVATIYSPGFAPPYGPRFVLVAAAGDDRTFVVEIVTTAGRIARFDEIRLNRSGKPGPLIRLRFDLPDPAGQALAITPDGREIATAFYLRKRSGIAVISTATGRIRRWAWSGPTPKYLAWSGDHRIDFVTSTGRGLRTLDTFAPGGDLGASRDLTGRLIRFAGVNPHWVWFIRQLVTTPDGRTAFVMVSSSRSVQASTFRYQVVSINAVNGAPRSVLTKTVLPTGGNSSGESYCGVMWADGSGRHVLVSCVRSGCLPGNPGCITFVGNLAPYIPYPDIPTAWGG